MTGILWKHVTRLSMVLIQVYPSKDHLASTKLDVEFFDERGLKSGPALTILWPSCVQNAYGC